jgi:hypothetical protein
VAVLIGVERSWGIERDNGNQNEGMEIGERELGGGRREKSVDGE